MVIYGRTPDAGGIVGNNVQRIVAGIQRRLEYLGFLSGYLHSFQPAYQLLAFAGKHDAGDHFDATGAGTVLHVEP